MPPPPSDDDLRAFLLGTLPTENAAAVQAWLDADPTRAARLDQLAAGDPLTDACSVAAGASPVPDATIDRIARGVAAALRDTPPMETPADANAGGTVAQPRVPRNASGWPPDRLGQFRVLGELGHGGMGYVFEAEDEKLGRRVAVKVLTPELARRPDATLRFLREARAAAAIEHENVVPILHVGEDGGIPFIVMPLLKGESLDKRLKRDGAVPVAEVVRIGREVAAGLGAAHARGLVHRDMKPANVWLDADTSRARVLDFGLARQGDGSDALTESGALQGTPAYMAPEQIDGHPADARSDLFALGAILYECATGQRAFPGATITAILKAVATSDPAPPEGLNPSVPPELSTLLLKLLAKDPAARPASTSVVQTILASVPSTSTTATVTWAHPAAHPARPPRSRALWLVGAVALAVLAAVGLWLGTRPPNDDQAKGTPTDLPVNPTPPQPPSPTPAPRYKGKVEVLVERDGRLLRLNETGALPLKRTDKFRIEGEVDPPAYLYVVWVDPDHDVTPVYPWNAAKGWGSRPAKEEPVGKVSLPENVGNRYTAPKAEPGVATIVLFARTTPLTEPDEVVKGWFESLPELPLPPSGDAVAVWFDDFVEVKDPLRRRTFGEVGSDDAFTRWQGRLQKALGGKVQFQTAVSFARTGRK